MNSDNLGVGALTLSNIELLRKAAQSVGLKPHFLVVGWRDARVDYEQFEDVETVPLRLRHIGMPGGPLSEAFRRSDIVFDIGGGDSFTDIYGLKRFLTIWGTKLRGLLTGVPLILSPQTVGPFNARWSQYLAKMVMRRASLVVTRDAPSTRYLSEIGLSANVLEATDCAMGLSYVPGKHLSNEKRVRVGINVSGLLYNGGYTRSNQFGLTMDYADVIHRISAWFHEKSDVELHFVGHVQSVVQEVEDDQRVCEKLVSEFPGSISAPNFGSPVDAKSYIASLDFFIGARMHAAIAAFSSKVPVVPMAYSRKFAGVFGTLGYDHVVDCTTQTAEEVLLQIQRSFEHRDELGAEIVRALNKTDARLDAYVRAAAAELEAAAKGA